MMSVLSRPDSRDWTALPPSDLPWDAIGPSTRRRRAAGRTDARRRLRDARGSRGRRGRGRRGSGVRGGRRRRRTPGAVPHRRAARRPGHVLAGALVEGLPGVDARWPGPRAAVHPSVGGGGGRRVRSRRAGLLPEHHGHPAEVGRRHPAVRRRALPRRSRPCLPRRVADAVRRPTTGAWSTSGSLRRPTCRANPRSRSTPGSPTTDGRSGWRSPAAGSTTSESCGRQPGGRRPGPSPRDRTGRSDSGRRHGSGRPTLGRAKRQRLDDLRRHQPDPEQRDTVVQTALHRGVAPPQVARSGQGRSGRARATSIPRPESPLSAPGSLR